MEEKYCQGDLNDIIRAGGVNPMHNAEKSKWDSPPQQLPNPNLAPFGHRLTNFNDSLLHELSGSNCVDGLAEATNSRAVADATGRSDLLSGGFHVSPVMAKGCSSTSMTGYDVASQKNLGLGRRKSQERKVVCIPAVESANARPGGGEVVPSDLWAWRKYGQKPIKGSPYPRGYYRCSSSKGCSARKQVERSRTNPNMLVITYTSEHNHSWPIQRNALAGSTRSYNSKSSSSNTKGSSHQGHNRMRASLMEETTNGMNISCNNMTIDNKVKEESGENIVRTSDAAGNELHQTVEQRYDAVDSDLNDQNDALSKNMGKSDTLGIITDKGEKDSNKAIDPFELLNRVGNWTVE